MAIFKGTFCQPGYSLVTPIKITGSGYCNVKNDGLLIRGFKQAPKLSVALFYFPFLAFVQFKLWPAMPQYLFISLFCGGLWLLMKGSGTDHKGEVIALLISWKHISSASLDKASDSVLIHVKKFPYQNQRFNGGLFFKPSDGSDSLLSALKDQNVKCTC